MFERIDIRLTEPICSCTEQNLAWSIWADRGKAALIVSCETCRTELKLPNEKFRARFVLGRPYPGKTPEQPKSEGNVIPFKRES